MRFDLTDEEWALLDPLMPKRRKGARVDDRKIMNAIFYVLRSRKVMRNIASPLQGVLWLWLFACRRCVDQVGNNTDLLQFPTVTRQRFSRCEFYLAAVGKLNIASNDLPTAFEYIFRANRKPRRQARQTTHLSSPIYSYLTAGTAHRFI